MGDSFTSDTHTNSKKRACSTSDESISCPFVPQHDGIRTSKRLRTSSSKALENPVSLHPPSPEVVYERRRVNPDSLAKRLGSELVGELDALILPGNRDMPSFAVRKELQERYNIDRRHLYDYFHSKGLRVVKEDKNGNPIRQTDQPSIVPQPTLRLLRQAPPKASMHVREYPSILADSKQKVPKPVPKSRAPKQPTIRLKKPDNPHKTATEKCHSPCYSAAEPQYSQAQQNYPQSTVSTPFVPSHFFTNPLQNYFAFGSDDDISKMDEPSSHPFVPVFEKMIKQEQMAPRSLYPSPLKPDYQAPQKTTASMDRQIMSQEERIAFYDFIDNVIGPPSGVQESVGTYKAHMAEQSRLYFERILPGSQDHMRKVRAQSSVHSQTTSQHQARSSGDTVDFRKWLVSNGSADNPLDDHRNTTSHYYPDGTLMLENILANNRSSASTLTSYGIEDNIPRTLDDLFPVTEYNWHVEDDALGSPVVRSNSSRSSMAFDTWKDHVVDDDDDAVISPTLAMYSPLIQQTSPDIQSSPLIQTPPSVYQQFIQYKNPHPGFFYSLQRAHQIPSLQDKPVMQHTGTRSPDFRSQDYNIEQESQASEELARYNPHSLSVRDIVSRKLARRIPSEMARKRTRSSGTNVTRMRTASAGGGI